MSSQMRRDKLKTIVLAIFVVPVVLAIVWYAVSFLPHLRALNVLASQGMRVKASADATFYPLAVAGETARGIRAYAIRQAYRSLVAEKSRVSSARRLFSEVLWLTASYMHFNDEEIFGIWVVCSLSGCGSGLMDASERYFNKQIEEMTMEELAGLVALVKSPSVFAPGTARGQKRKQMILEKQRAGS